MRKMEREAEAKKKQQERQERLKQVMKDNEQEAFKKSTGSNVQSDTVSAQQLLNINVKGKLGNKMRKASANATSG